MKEIIDNELDRDLLKHQKRKKIGIILTKITLLFIPYISFLLIVSFHSKRLISNSFQLGLKIFSGIIIILLIIGLLLLINNIKVRDDKIGNIFLKSIYYVFVGVSLLCVMFFLYIMYGPSDEFRQFIIEKEYNKNYCKWFYTDDEIDKYISNDEDKEKSTDEKKEEKKEIEYANEYEKAVLIKDKGNDDYKYIPIKVGGYDAHLVVIYDPSKIHLITSKKFNTGTSMESILNMCKRLNGKVCINGGRFLDLTGWGSDTPKGILIKDKKVIWSDEGEDAVADLVGFTDDNKLLLVTTTAKDAINKGMRDALEFGPFLMVNGQVQKFDPNAAGGYGRAARVALAQRKDGIVLFLVTEGVHVKGPNFDEVIEALSLYGAYNIANLDGGASAQLVIENKLINDPKNIYGESVVGGRKVVSGFGLLN